MCAEVHLNLATTFHSVVERLRQFGRPEQGGRSFTGMECEGHDFRNAVPPKCTCTVPS